MAEYTFARGVAAKTFCRTCGVQMTNHAANLSKEKVDALPEEDKAFFHRLQAMHAVNARVLDNIDLGKLRPKIQRIDRDFGPAYINP